MQFLVLKNYQTTDINFFFISLKNISSILRLAPICYLWFEVAVYVCLQRVLRGESKFIKVPIFYRLQWDLNISLNTIKIDTLDYKSLTLWFWH